MLSDDDAVFSTMETVLVHIDMVLRKSCEIPENISASVNNIRQD